VAVMGTDAGSLASQAVFALGRAGVRDVAVAGRIVVEDGRHAMDEEIRERYRAVQKRFVEEGGR
jgi:formimidoylglutamate deiminase